MSFFAAWLLMVLWTLICFLIGYAGGRWDEKEEKKRGKQ